MSLIGMFENSHQASLAAKIAPILLGAAISFASFQPAKAQDPMKGIDLMATYMAYLRACGEWTGPISDEHTNRVVAVAQAAGFEPSNRQHINLIAAKSVEWARLWQASAGLATRCAEAKFTLTN